MKHRVLRTIGLSVLAFLTATSPVLASSYSPSSFTTTSSVGSWVYQFDSVDFFIYPKWNSAQRAGIQNYVSQGGRYSQDMADVSGVLNAEPSYWGTNFESPVLDLDDEEFPQDKYEEAEVTATSTVFPVVGKAYYFLKRFSHTYHTCDPYSCTQYDPNDGYLDHDSQISFYGCCPFEWQTRWWTFLREVHYPYQSKGSKLGLSASTDGHVTNSAPAEPKIVRDAPPTRMRIDLGDGLAVNVTRKNHETDAWVDTQSGGWQAYANTSRIRAERLFHS